MAILQELEQEAYQAVLLCLATQPLDWAKESLLGDLRDVLHITNDDHKRHLDSVLADPRVEAIKRGDDDVPMSLAGRPIGRQRASSPPLPSVSKLNRIGSQRGRPANVRISDQGEVKRRPGRPPAAQPVSPPVSHRRSIKRSFDDELPMESPFLQPHLSSASDFGGSRGRGRGRNVRRVSNVDSFLGTAVADLPALASGQTASGLPLAQHLPVVRPLLDAYLHAGDVALLEGMLQRMTAREQQLQEELSAAQRLQGSFADELELRTLQLQDLEAAEKRRRNELIDQRAVIAMNEQ